MTTLEKLIASRNHFGNVVAHLQAAFPGTRQWTLMDMATGRTSTLHLRPWLAETDLPPGCRVEEPHEDADDGRGEAGIGGVAEPRPGVAISRDALARFADAHSRGLPTLLFQARLESEAVMDVRVVRGGEALEVASVADPRAEHAEITVRGDPARRMTGPLPLRFEVSSAFPEASIEIEAGPGLPEAGRRTTFKLNSQGGAIGTGFIKVDAALGRLGGDRLIVRSEGFADRVRVDPVAADDEAVSWTDGPVRLHLVLDRTTLDARAWISAYQMNLGWSSDTGKSIEGAASWNRETRQSLADALAHATSTAFPSMRVHLYWFADRPRLEGVAAPRHLGHLASDQSVGRIGEVLSSHLAQTLTGGCLGYIPGLDLCDAADEALEMVAAAVPALGAEARDLVVIVGDSPPPPANRDDPLWTALLTGAVRSSARTSPKFLTSLAALRRRRVPVGWLFLRDPREPEADELWLRQYAKYRHLRELAHEGLRAVDGLTVRPCGDLQNMGSDLVSLLRDLTSQTHGVPLVRVSPLQEVG